MWAVSKAYCSAHTWAVCGGVVNGVWRHSASFGPAEGNSSGVNAVCEGQCRSKKTAVASGSHPEPAPAAKHRHAAAPQHPVSARLLRPARCRARVLMQLLHALQKLSGIQLWRGLLGGVKHGASWQWVRAGWRRSWEPVTDTVSQSHLTINLHHLHPSPNTLPLPISLHHFSRFLQLQNLPSTCNRLKKAITFYKSSFINFLSLINFQY